MSSRGRIRVKGQTLIASTSRSHQTAILSASVGSIPSTSDLSEAITRVSLTTATADHLYSNAQISLFNWIFKFCRDEFAVHLEGKAKSHLNPTVTCRSGAITQRLQSGLLKSKNGKLYQLQGPICRISCEMLGYPTWLIDEFFCGFPENWKSIMEDYFKDRRKLRSAHTLSSWLEVIAAGARKRMSLGNSPKRNQGKPHSINTSSTASLQQQAASVQIMPNTTFKRPRSPSSSNRVLESPVASAKRSRFNEQTPVKSTVAPAEQQTTRLFRNGAEVIQQMDKTSRISPGVLSSDPEINHVYDHDLISFHSSSPDASVVSGFSLNSSIGPSVSSVGETRRVAVYDAVQRYTAVAAANGLMRDCVVVAEKMSKKPAEEATPIAPAKKSHLGEERTMSVDFTNTSTTSSHSIVPPPSRQPIWKRTVLSPPRREELPPPVRKISPLRPPAKAKNKVAGTSHVPVQSHGKRDGRRRLRVDSDSSDNETSNDEADDVPIPNRDIRPSTKQKLIPLRKNCPANCAKGKSWSEEEEQLLIRATKTVRPVSYYQVDTWKRITQTVGSRSMKACQSHAKKLQLPLAQRTDVAVVKENRNGGKVKTKSVSPPEKAPVVSSKYIPEVTAKKGTLKWRNEAQRVMTEAVRKPIGAVPNDDYFEGRQMNVHSRLMEIPGLSDSILGNGNSSMSSAVTPLLNNTGRFFIDQSGGSASGCDSPQSAMRTDISADRRNMERYLFKATKGSSKNGQIPQPESTPKLVKGIMKKPTGTMKFAQILAAAERPKQKRLSLCSDDSDDVYFSDD